MESREGINRRLIIWIEPVSYGQRRQRARRIEGDRFIYVERRNRPPPPGALRRRKRRSVAGSYIGSAINTARRSPEDRDRKRRIHGGVASARFIGGSCFLFPFSLFFSLPRASARHSLRGKPPAEMRRAATREWNIIA